VQTEQQRARTGGSWATPFLVLLVPACIGAGAGLLKNNETIPSPKEVVLKIEYAAVCKTGIKDRSHPFCRKLFDDIKVEKLNR